MYVCGVTVYDRCHLGHARSAIVFDVIRRYLKFKGYKVRYVRNFTDVDDKIIQRANREGRPWTEIVERYLAAYEEDMKRLGIESADREPKATEHIPDMIRLIQKLIQRDFAYLVDGNVYYDVKKFKAYGKLSKRKTEELLTGVRVEPDERKKNPLDFALWKAAKPGEPFWDSPWGPGRPGWHIECSAMAMKLLGNSFDIHGGGMDLIFPHHENEIAQSEAATRRPFARYWLHNGFVNINQEKMSKSLGNFFTIQEIFEKAPPYGEKMIAEIIRFFLLSTHYRRPVDFSDEALKTAKAGLDNFYTMFVKLSESSRRKHPSPDIRLSPPNAERRGRSLIKALEEFPKKFEKAMDDDFNTPEAMGEFQKLRAVVNRYLEGPIEDKLIHKIQNTFKLYGKILGLFSIPSQDWITAPWESQFIGREKYDDARIEALLKEREEARRMKDWARSDEIRRELGKIGVILEDRPDGTTRWRR